MNKPIIFPITNKDSPALPGYSLPFLFPPLKLPSVTIAIPNCKLSFSMRSLPFKLAFILHVYSPDLSFTISQTLLKVAFVYHPISPLICSSPIGFSFFKSSLEEITIWKVLLALSVLQEARKITFILLAMASEMYPIALDFAVEPLPHVDISLRRFPNSSAVLLIMKPFPRVVLSIFPKELTNLRSLVANKLAFVSTFRSDLYSLGFLRTYPFSLKYPVAGNHNTPAVHISLFHIPEVERLLLHQFYSKVWTFDHLFQVHVIVRELIAFYECGNVFLERYHYFLLAFLLKSVFFKVILDRSFFSIICEQGKHINFHKLLSFLDVFKSFHVRRSLCVLKSGRALCVVCDGAISPVFDERFIPCLERGLLFCIATIGLLRFGDKDWRKCVVSIIFVNKQLNADRIWIVSRRCRYMILMLITQLLNLFKQYCFILHSIARQTHLPTVYYFNNTLQDQSKQVSYRFNSLCSSHRKHSRF